MLAKGPSRMGEAMDRKLREHETRPETFSCLRVRAGESRLSNLATRRVVFQVVSPAITVEKWYPEWQNTSRGLESNNGVAWSSLLNSLSRPNPVEFRFPWEPNARKRPRFPEVSTAHLQGGGDLSIGPSPLPCHFRSS